MKRSLRLIVVEDRGGELVVGDDAKEIADSRSVETSRFAASLRNARTSPTL